MLKKFEDFKPVIVLIAYLFIYAAAVLPLKVPDTLLAGNGSVLQTGKCMGYLFSSLCTGYSL